MSKVPVAIVECDSYNREKVDAAVRTAVGLLPEFTSSITPNMRVLFKVNLTWQLEDGRSITTHPSVVLAAARLVQECGATVTLGEGSGWSAHPMWRKIRSLMFERLHGTMKGRKFHELEPLYDSLMSVKTVSELSRFTHPDTHEPLVRVEDLGIGSDIDVFSNAGIQDVADETGARLAFFDTEETVEIPSPTARYLATVPACKSIAEADRIISLCKIKTHDDAILTGGIKNFFGIVPTPVRGGFHSTSKFGGMINEMLVDVFSVVKPPPMVISDAVVAIEGKGPIFGEERRMNLILASTDCVAHDAVMCALTGKDPMEIPTVRLAHESGLGQGLLENIEVRGTPVEKVAQPDWKFSLNPE
ncbi:MAG: DUF362 domain-containing protein [Chitinivibrionales bacterium]|nr:DUF362 domain-containing protein [Chitinivibrionales bacterium]MBD3394977.1 DUF362 domain-containing protein [Chitinivibrionales bacterium]